MGERPILFSGPMVRAILAGRKTQTRRVVKCPPRTTDWVVSPENDGKWWPTDGGDYVGGGIACPYGAVGDRLWVRETHARFSVGEGMDRPVPECVAYRATCDAEGGFDYTNGRGEVMRLKVTKWTPAIHMPRWASRLTLEVTGVRVERLHAITDADARAEGCRGVGGAVGQMEPSPPRTAREAFSRLWSEINGAESWDANPWVWVVAFRRVEVNRG